MNFNIIRLANLTHIKQGNLLLVLVLFISAGYTTQIKAQQDDDLYIFGFSQVILNNKVTSFKIQPSNAIPVSYETTFRNTSFALHQVNLFFQKPINSRVTFFLNMEATGSYSSKTPSGALEFPEGWLSYRFSNQLEVKAGLLLPKFNNLTEIKNRLPLFPYLIRPILYETLLSNLITPEDYKPENAYFQITWNNPIFKNKQINAAFYLGNAENSYLSKVEGGAGRALNKESAAFYLGEDLSTTLLVGGRIGIENDLRTFKFGISGTIDKDNRTEIEQSVFRLDPLITPVLGEIPRYRLGIDFSFVKHKFAFESEYMGVFHDHSSFRAKPAFENLNLNKLFIYSNLTYNFTEKYYVFGFASYHKDYSYELLSNNTPDAAGLTILSSGGGYRPIDEIVIKVQYTNAWLLNNDFLDANISFFSLGLSTIF